MSPAVYAAVIASILTLGYCVIRLLTAVEEYFVCKSDQIVRESFDAGIRSAVRTAVGAVRQADVEDLKEIDRFGEDEHREAFAKALWIAKARLTQTDREVLEELYGSVDEYLAPMIEEEVGRWN